MLVYSAGQPLFCHLL